MISLVFIILCAVMAVFAYFIIPDNTPDANTQILEISTQKPGFEVDILLVNKPANVEKVGFWHKLMNGQPSPYRQIPLDSLKIEEKTTTVYIFNPEHSGAVQEDENKTYGVCRETGKLIPKERLRAVPHATLCIEAKQNKH